MAGIPTWKHRNTMNLMHPHQNLRFSAESNSKDRYFSECHLSPHHFIQRVPIAQRASGTASLWLGPWKPAVFVGDTGMLLLGNSVNSPISHPHILRKDRTTARPRVGHQRSTRGAVKIGVTSARGFTRGSQRQLVTRQSFGVSCNPETIWAVFKTPVAWWL